MSSDKKPIQIGQAQRGADKVARIPVKIEPTTSPKRKPRWIRAKAPTSPEVGRIKNLLRQNNLHTVCEEASCPNLGECFSHGTATFMIMGDICTRRCPFCDVAHGRPNPLDAHEPEHLAQAINTLNLNYVVITSVDRDDLRDGGADHFVQCIKATRTHSPKTKIEILVPDFRGRMDVALEIMQQCPPDVFNHNLETIPRLYKASRPGSDYHWSLQLLQRFKETHKDISTKSGLMLGLGENKEEIIEVLKDLHAHKVDMITLGQYLQPTVHHLPVDRYVEPAEFDELAQIAKDLGFKNVASGPMVRSSYHADLQASGETIR